MRSIMNGCIPLHILVILLSPWWWAIIQRDTWSGLLVFVLSFVVFQYFISTKKTPLSQSGVPLTSAFKLPLSEEQLEEVFSFKLENLKRKPRTVSPRKFIKSKSRTLLLLLLSLTAILFIISVRKAFDENILRSSALDIQQYNRRHEFYANSLGKIYKNRYSLAYFKEYHLPLYKLQRNFFANLDPNLYFFSSHPRERLGIEEFKKYSPFFLPLFLIGFFYCIYIKLSKILIYSIVISLLSSMISPKYNLGPILFFPIISFMIVIGIILSLRGILKYLKR